MKIYLSGPMTGHPNNNEAMFRVAAEQLRAAGHVVTSPTEFDAEEDLGRDATDKEYEEYMARDLAVVPQHDAVAFLPGWEKSGGAGREGRVAVDRDLELYTWDPERPRTLSRLWDWEFLADSITERAPLAA